MDLHGIAASAIGAVNPFVPVTIRISTGRTISADGTPIPTYDDPIVGVSAQIQPMTFNDLRQTEGLNLQGTKRGIYLEGNIDAIVRLNQKGGDLITMEDGSVWLTVLILESWVDWVKAAIVLQQDGA